MDGILSNQKHRKDDFMNIFIAAHYNLNNGDRALLEATLQILNRIAPKSNITVSAAVPKLLSDSRFSTVGWAIPRNRLRRCILELCKISFMRKFLKKHIGLLCKKSYIKAVQDADIVFISGGHHLTDILSVNSYSMLAANFYVPIALGKKVVLLPQSIGPAQQEEIRSSIRYILNKSHSVAYRDKSSEKFIKELNIDCSAIKVPDLVYSLKPDKRITDDKTVGVALYHAYTGEKKMQILPFTIRNLVLVLDELIRKDYRVKIILMDGGDEELAQQIYENLKSDDKQEKYFVADRGNTILDLISEFSGLSFVLAYKTHSTIFSMICETPLVSIAYHPKAIDFMRDAGLESYAMYDKDASYKNIMSIIEMLNDNLEAVRNMERESVEKNREAINSYFQELDI